jgi:ABC-2 type transport system ATP-binding protein
MDSIIKVKNLTKSFKDFKAVDSVSFEVKRGESFAFLGPNGAGKSTTIKMLTTLLAPTEGEITLNGFNPVNDPIRARQSFGIVFQDPSIDDDLTASENLMLHASLYNVKGDRKQKIQKLLEFVDLWDRRDSLAKTFSGGMKRRLEIARGLLHTPKILFLDEPTVGLDPQTRNHMWEYLKDVKKKENMTVFFTTHYMEEAEKYADRVVIIDHGKVMAEGSVESLKKQFKAKSLEDAFLKITGHVIRDEEAKGIDHLRQMRRMHAGK